MDVPELANVSSVSKAYIWQIESGRRKMPSGDVLLKLAGSLGVTVSELLGADEGIPEEDLEEVPKALRELVERKGRELRIRREDVEMLKHIHFRGRRPSKQEDWELIFLFIKRILG